MKKVLLITILAAMAVAGYSQTTNTPPATGKGFLGPNAHDWAVIPFFAYDVTIKKPGGGAAILYMASTNFWTGFRMQSVNGREATAGVQAQIQVTKKIGPVNVTPFAETSGGIGSSSLYANAGAGALISFGDWKLGSRMSLEAGIIGDYEHYVWTDASNSHGNQFNIGPLVVLHFP